MTELTNESEIPVPDSSGSSGEQEFATGEVLGSGPPTGLFPLADAVNKGIAANPKALGGFGSALLNGLVQHFVYEKEELKRHIVELRQSLNTQSEQREKERINSVALAARLKSELDNRHFRNGGISVGTTLVSAGVFGSSSIGVHSWPLILIGALFILASWFGPIRQDKTTPTNSDGN